jgi:hypothetical protein
MRVVAATADEGSPGAAWASFPAPPVQGVTAVFRDIRLWQSVGPISRVESINSPDGLDVGA